MLAWEAVKFEDAVDESTTSLAFFLNVAKLQRIVGQPRPTVAICLSEISRQISA